MAKELNEEELQDVVGGDENTRYYVRCFRSGNKTFDEVVTGLKAKNDAVRKMLIQKCHCKVTVA